MSAGTAAGGRKPAYGAANPLPAILHTILEDCMLIIVYCMHKNCAEERVWPCYRFGMKISALEGTTRAERLADEIAASILSGEFRPGFDWTKTRWRSATRFLELQSRSSPPTRFHRIDRRQAAPRRNRGPGNISASRDAFRRHGGIEATCARLSAMSMTPLAEPAWQVFTNPWSSSSCKMTAKDSPTPTSHCIRRSIWVLTTPSLPILRPAYNGGSHLFAARNFALKDAFLARTRNTKRSWTQLLRAMLRPPTPPCSTI